MTDPVADMEMGVRALYAAVDSSVAQDMDRRWMMIKASGILVFKPGHPEPDKTVLCRLWGKYLIMSWNGNWFEQNGLPWAGPAESLEWAELP